MAVSISTIREWFRTGLKPTQEQFWSTWDSFWHKDEQIPIQTIENLQGTLETYQNQLDAIIPPSKTTYLILENPSDLRELILLENYEEGDTVIVENYLYDVVHFVRRNSGWQRVTPFNIKCVLRKNNTTGKFDLLDSPNHRPIGARYIITDPFGTGSYQFAVCYPNADNVVGSLVATADESDGSKGYIIGGSVGGRIGIMRITATNGFPIRVARVPNTNTYEVQNISSDNVPSNYFTVTIDVSNNAVVSHSGLNLAKNLYSTVSSNNENPHISSERTNSVTVSGGALDIEIDPDPAESNLPDFTIYRHGTYTVPIDLLEASGNYWISGEMQSKEQVHTLNLNDKNTASFDQPHILSGEFTIEFGVNNIQSEGVQSMLGHRESPLKDNVFFFDGVTPFLILNGTNLEGASDLKAAIGIDNYIRIRRDANNDIFLKLNNNQERLMGTIDYDWPIDEIFKGANELPHSGYIRNLRIGNEYYNFSEQMGSKGASVYNSANNPRTFTVTLGDSKTSIWGTL